MAKVIVITGASAGIGAALAIRFGQLGHQLALGARTASRLDDVARRAVPNGGASAARVATVVMDATKRADVERLRDQAIEQFGHVDVWINNAGRGIARPVLQLTDEDIDEMIAVNLKSVVYGMQTIIPHFIERGGGHVINMSSALGRVPAASFRSAYSAAKAAVNSLSSNVRMDLIRQGQHDVHVSVVMPGVVTTDFNDNAKYSTGGGPPRPAPNMPVPQSVDDVVAVVELLLDEPRAEVYTNPVHPALVERYVKDPGAFEARVSS